MDARWRTPARLRTPFIDVSIPSPPTSESGLRIQMDLRSEVARLERALRSKDRELKKCEKERDFWKEKAPRNNNNDLDTGNQNDGSIDNEGLALLEAKFADPLKKIMQRVDMFGPKDSLAFRGACKGLWRFGQSLPMSLEIDIKYTSVNCDTCERDHDEGHHRRIFCYWQSNGETKKLSAEHVSSLEKSTQVTLSVSCLVFETSSYYAKLEKFLVKMGIEKIKRVHIKHNEWSLNDVIQKYKVERVTGLFFDGAVIAHKEIRNVNLTVEWRFAETSSVQKCLETCVSPCLTFSIPGAPIHWENLCPVLKMWIKCEKWITKWEVDIEIPKEDFLVEMETLAETMKDHVRLKLLPQDYLFTRTDGLALVVKRREFNRSRLDSTITFEILTA